MNQVFDAVIVGAGFSGLHMLQKLREGGFSVKLYEAASGLGGTWYWNSYPGARVDSDCQIYQFVDHKLWKDFQWTERFPSWAEVHRYFKYADEKLNFSKDIEFNTRVTKAVFHSSCNQWFVTTRNGTSTWTGKLILCTGFASRRHTPPFPGIECFKGECYHTGAWPKDAVDFRDKRVAIIGTGVSGVHVIEKIAPEVRHLTVYQRTPNLTLPICQYSASDEHKWKLANQNQLQIFEYLKETFVGFNMDFFPKNAADATPEERQTFYEGLFQKGGFSFWIANYRDLLFNEESNNYAYKFWCERARARITDPIKLDILAPLTPIYPFGVKRPALEQCYYERLNQNNVDIINLRESPIIAIVNDGVKTEKEGVIPVDILILATGYESVADTILSIDITNGEGDALQDKWKRGVSTCLGMMTAGYPNLFFMFGPQSTNRFSNGPTCADIQSTWIMNLLVHMRKYQLSRVDATTEAEKKWCRKVQELWDASLLSVATNNNPVQPGGPFVYYGGVPAYNRELGDCAKKNYEGFVFI